MSISIVQQKLRVAGFDSGPIDGMWGRKTAAALDEALGLDGAPAIPADYWSMLSRIESEDRPYVRATSSSASGLYQFIKSTWIAEGGVSPWITLIAGICAVRSCECGARELGGL